MQAHTAKTHKKTDTLLNVRQVTAPAWTLAGNNILVSSTQGREHRQNEFAVVTAIIQQFGRGLAGMSLFSIIQKAKQTYKKSY